ncbi:TetR/AcrR family transcriptional regulator [Pediococcus acidilactici]
MPSETLVKLKPTKKAAIEAALLAEFSRYPVAEAQVARIVKDAGISRGAFYNYFADLIDAYRYIYQVAMHDIHQSVHGKMARGLALLSTVRGFVENAQSSKYYRLLQMHFRHNEAYVAHWIAPVKTGGARQWAQQTLVHDTLRGAIVEPETAEARLAQLTTILKILEE